MEDRSIASAGVGLAGIALVAASLPWEATSVGPVENVVLAVLAGVAFGAFALGRRALLGPTPTALVAGSASFGVVGVVGAPALAGERALADAGALVGTSPSPWATGLALVGGIGGVIAAYGDARGFPAEVRQAVEAIAWSLFVGFSGLFAIALWSTILLSVVAGVVPGDPSSAVRLAVGAVALGLGTGTVALLYFQWTDETFAYLDFRVPSKGEVMYVFAGIFALVALQIVVGVVFQQLGLETASHSTEQAAMGNARVLLLLIPAAWLVIGPGEELLYRNIVQKSLYDSFGDWGAVLVASVVFALAHIPAYAAGASLTSLLNTLVVIFGLSVVLGVTYLKTENTTVPALVHGTFDVVVFGAMYAQMSGMA